MNAGIRRVGILCSVLVFAGAAALVLSGQTAPAWRDGGVPMVQLREAPGGDGDSARAVPTADRPGKFSQSAQALVGEGITAQAMALVSEPMLDAASGRPVRSVAIIVTVMDGARLLHNTHDLCSMSAEASELITFSAEAISGLAGDMAEDFSYELCIQPRNGLTWGATSQQGDLTIEIARGTD